MPASSSAGAVALLAQSRRFEVAATAEEPDPAVAELDQVPRGRERTLEVLRRERRERGRAGVRVDGHDRLIRVHLGDGRCDQDGAVGERAAETRHVPPLPADVVAAVTAGVDDQLVLAAAQRVGGALQHLGAERLDVGDQHADHVGALASAGCGR